MTKKQVGSPLVIKRKLPKGRVPHRPTKVEPLKTRYNRKKLPRLATP